MADKASVEELAKMKVTDLKKVLKEKGLSVSGTKSELVERLSQLEAEDSVLDEDVDLTETPIKEDPVEIQTTTDAAEETSVPKDTTSSPIKITEVTAPVKVSTGGLSETERLKKRAERFGVINEDIKKLARADRFGITETATASPASAKLSTEGSTANVDLLKKRAARFGQVLSSSLSKVDEEEKILKRKERFGGDVTAATNNTSTPPKFAKITFNSTEDDAKKNKRAERFGASAV